MTNTDISGDTTAGGLLPGCPRCWSSTKADAGGDRAGGNDGLRGSPVAAAKANLLKMARAGQSRWRQCWWSACGCRRNFAELTAQFEAMYAEVAKSVGGGLVPFFLDRIGTDLSKFQADKIHPDRCAAGAARHRVASAGEVAEMSAAPIWSPPPTSTAG